MNGSPIIETEMCSRCHGSGNYSYCQSYGTRCFKCAGSGKQLTARGKAVRAYINELATVRAADLKPGMRVSITDITASIKATLKTVEHRDDSTVHIVTNGDREYAYSPDCTLYRVLTNDDWSNEVRAKAIAYRDSLTLAGKPRKRSQR